MLRIVALCVMTCSCIGLGFMKSLGLTNPKVEIISRYAELGGEIITFGSDAHTPQRVGECFEEAGEIVKTCGFKYYAVYKERKPVFYKL